MTRTIFAPGGFIRLSGAGGAGDSEESARPLQAVAADPAKSTRGRAPWLEGAP